MDAAPAEVPSNAQSLPRLEYPLAQAPEDIQRLIARVSRRNAGTREVLRQAGLAPGMRVLDAGSGAGDVAMMAAELVGPTGSVLGIDRNTVSLEVARARAEAAGFSNLQFSTADAQDVAALGSAGPFDAIVGRLVLMYTHQPATTLRGLMELARPGAIVAFEEIDFTVIGWAMHPPGPLFQRVKGWINEGFTRMGTPPMGFELHPTFLAAGLPAPTLQFHTVIGAGAEWGLYETGAGVIASLLPNLIAHGITTAEEVDIDTLAARLRDEAVALQATSSAPPLIGAWSRKPARSIS